MPRETKQELKKRTALIIKQLGKAFPEAGTALDHRTPVQLLVATILSAQCTDARVNKVTPSLFARFPAAADLARADRAELEELIRSTGFFRNKAKSIQGAAQKIVQDFGGRVPETMEELLSLPGVARKTANVVLGNGFGKAAGVVVDTHVFRLAHRLGLSKGKNPKDVEKDLMEIVPKKEWIGLGNRLIYHGRATCLARKPRCETCFLEPLCPRLGVKQTSTSPRPAVPARRPLRERIQGSRR
ncbi:MAG TPA: endonuclease III [Vicinamibacteria bacterium]|jgi:endonuclease-3